MMKDKYYISCLLFILIGISSCSDFLEEENKSAVTAENFYTTSDGYEALINSCYATLTQVHQSPYMFTSGTDLFFGSHQDAPRGLTGYESLTPATPEVGNLFSTLYESIQVTNTALDYKDRTEDFPQLTTRIGEARFLRAYYYFHLVRQFGDVSLVKEMVTRPITSFDRDPQEEVYQFIIDELQTAVNQVPATQSDHGRVTKRAVRHLLAKVYLTRGYKDFGASDDFSTAATYANSAINGQSLNLDYENVFGYDQDVNEEVIFSIQYDDAAVSQGGSRHNWDYPWGPLVQGSGVSKKNILHPTENLFKLYGENDARFRGSFMHVMTSPYVGWILDRENSPVSFYYPRTDEQIADTAAWRSQDSGNRSGTTIVPMGPTWWNGNNQESFPALKKFDRIQTTEVNFTHDLYLFRLGGTYLLAAEANFQAGNLPAAANRINEVRSRAAKEGHESDMQVSESEIDLDFILDERARELAGEGKRWYALKRTGKLVERTRQHNPEIKSFFDSGVNPFEGANGNLKILRPIPLSAINLDSEGYRQNPAYESGD